MDGSNEEENLNAAKVHASASLLNVYVMYVRILSEQ